MPEVDRGDEEADSVADLLRQIQKLHPHSDVWLHPGDEGVAFDGFPGGVGRQGEPKSDLGTGRWWVLGVDEATPLADVLDSGLNGRRVGRVGRVEGSLNPNRGTLTPLI